MTPLTCGGCDSTWTGLGRAHCAACHRTFATAALFDQHRSARGEHGSCVDPEAIRHGRTGERLMFLRHGMWCGPEMSEDAKARAFGKGDAA